MKQQIEAEGGELVLQNDSGDTVIIPKDSRQKVLKMLETNSHADIDEYVTTLPYKEDYAQDGTLIPDGEPTKTKTATVSTTDVPQEEAEIDWSKVITSDYTNRPGINQQVLTAAPETTFPKLNWQSTSGALSRYKMLMNEGRTDEANKIVFGHFDPSKQTTPYQEGTHLESEQKGLIRPIRAGDLEGVSEEYQKLIPDYGALQEGVNRYKAYGGIVDLAQEGAVLEGGGGETPTKRKYTKTSDVPKRAPFLSDWLDDPITQEKLKEQVGEEAYGVAKENLQKLEQYDLLALADKDPKQLTQEYMQKRNLRGSKDFTRVHTAMSKMKEAGEKYLQKGSGTSGVSFKRGLDLDIIGTVNDIMDADVLGVSTHEQTHASGIQYPVERFIKTKWADQYIPEDKLPEIEGYMEHLSPYYRDTNEGVYPRIMQLRKALDLKPGQEVTKDMLEKEGKKEYPKGSASPLRGLRHNYPDDALIDIMNTVAEVSTENDNVYTKDGFNIGKLT